jgi:hypothetical protein
VHEFLVSGIIGGTMSCWPSTSNILSAERDNI